MLDIKPELRLTKHQDGMYSLGVYSRFKGIEAYNAVGSLSGSNIQEIVERLQKEYNRLASPLVLAGSTVVGY